MFEFTKCQICNTQPQILAASLGICSECVKKNPEEAIERSRSSHSKNRAKWYLTPDIPNSLGGQQCHICSNECLIGLGESGYCGIRKNVNGHLESIAGKNKALLHTYLDPIPTNCCSTYFCPGGTSAGYPQFSYHKGPERGYYNLACFLYGCNFSCLGCQNDQHRAVNAAEIYTFDKFVSKIQNNPKVIKKRIKNTRKIWDSREYKNKQSKIQLKNSKELIQKIKTALNNKTQEEKDNMIKKRKQTCLKKYGVKNVFQVKEF